MCRAVRRTVVAVQAIGLGLAVVGCSSNPTEPSSQVSTWQVEHDACLARAVFGNPTQSLYILPYAVGSAYRVSASYCDASSQHYNELAYDFAMPIGAEIIAARAGVVEAVVDSFDDAGTDNTRSNYIAIRHDDGTVAGYGHTQQWGSVARVGDRVAQGQVIGHSGSSGTGGFPHLHMGVFPTVVWRRTDDVAFNFRNADGPPDPRGGLAQGATYASMPFQ